MWFLYSIPRRWLSTFGNIAKCHHDIFHDFHMWNGIQANFIYLPSLFPPSLLPPGFLGAPVVRSGGIHSPAAVHVTGGLVVGGGGWGGNAGRGWAWWVHLCVYPHDRFNYCFFILISYHFFSSQLPCFTCCWSVLRLLYVFRICLFVCWSVHPHLSCASSLIMCTIITSHTLFQCDFTLVDFYACSEYQHSYCE